MSANTMETDALNALSTIPGVVDIVIESNNGNEVKMSYAYTSESKFWQTDEYLGKFCLERADWK